jgi:hypothetical protein
MISGEWRPFAEALAILNHKGHADQRTHGRKGGKAEGQDLIGAGAADLANGVVAARAGFEGRSRDTALSAIAQRQGFDGPPQVVSRAEMDQLIASGRPELLRGVQAPKDGSKTAEQIQEEMRSGDAQFGTGVFGNGYYFAPPGGQGFASAERFGSGPDGAMARATLRPDAKVVGYAQVRAEHEAYFATLGHKPTRASLLHKNPTPRSNEDAVFADLGRFAAAKGYDAIEMGDTEATGYISPQMLVVNRTALIVEEAAP